LPVVSFNRPTATSDSMARIAAGFETPSNLVASVTLTMGCFGSSSNNRTDWSETAPWR
jgi:hypothetical protein